MSLFLVDTDVIPVEIEVSERCAMRQHSWKAPYPIWSDLKTLIVIICLHHVYSDWVSSKRKWKSEGYHVVCVQYVVIPR